MSLGEKEYFVLLLLCLNLSFFSGSGECTGDVQKLKFACNAYYEDRRSSYDLFLLRSYDPERNVLSNTSGKFYPLL